MLLNKDLVLSRLQLDLHNHLSDLDRKGDSTYEKLYEMERWALAAVSGFQEIVATVIDREAEEGRGYQTPQ